MKLCAIVNVWDADELLRPMLQQVRPHVELVVAMWQDISNYGERHNPSEAIDDCIESGLIDVTAPYVPDMTPRRYQGTYNETVKRNRGLSIARKQGCTHYLHLDCDEFYDPAQFAAAREMMDKSGYDSSACRMRTYYRRPTYQLTPPESYWVPFIHRVHPRTVCGHQNGAVGYPVTTDPTRTAHPVGRFLPFQREELEMHHMSWVRRDIGRKLRNHSSSAKFAVNLESSIRAFEEYQIGDPLVWPLQDHAIVEVPDRFGLSPIFEEAVSG